MTGAAALLDAGKLVDALIQLAKDLERCPADAEIYQTAFKAIIEATAHPEKLGIWSEPAKSAFYAKAMRQEACPERPLIFAHKVVSHLTSGAAGPISKLVREIEPVLRAEIETDPSKNLVVFLLAVREFVGTWISQKSISDLHIAWFERFEAADIDILYNAMFKIGRFGKNRDDILKYFVTKDKKTILRLSPVKILLYEWLSGQDYFDAQRSRDLADFLTTHLGDNRGDESDRRAARSMIIRYWQPDSILNQEFLKGLGLDPSILDLAKSAANVRAGLVKSQSGSATLGARFLQSKPYQLAGAARSLAVRSLNIRTHRKPKVAICVSGQLRGYKAALHSWRRTLLTQVDATFFVHSWHMIGGADANPTRHVLPFKGRHFTDAYRKVALQEGYGTLQAHYPALFKELNSHGEADEEELKSLYETDHVVLEDEEIEKFSSFSNQDKMHYKIFSANNMVENSNDFDLIIRIRPDIEIIDILFFWKDIQSVCHTQPIIFAEKPYGVHYGALMIGDQFAIGAPKAISVYAKTWNQYPKFAAAELAKMPNTLSGHVSLATSCWLQRVDVLKAPIRFGRLLDPTPFSEQAMYSILTASECGAGFHKTLVDAAKRDLS